eukprot:1410193-Amphidinium_carterae.1
MPLPEKFQEELINSRQQLGCLKTELGNANQLAPLHKNCSYGSRANGGTPRTCHSLGFGVAFDHSRILQRGQAGQGQRLTKLPLSKLSSETNSLVRSDEVVAIDMLDAALLEQTGGRTSTTTGTKTKVKTTRCAPSWPSTSTRVVLGLVQSPATEAKDAYDATHLPEVFKDLCADTPKKWKFGAAAPRTGRPPSQLRQ